MAVRTRRAAVIDILDDDRLLARIAALKDDNNLTGLRETNKKERGKQTRQSFRSQTPRASFVARSRSLPAFALDPRSSRDLPPNVQPSRARPREASPRPDHPIAPTRRHRRHPSVRQSSVVRTLRNLTISSVRGKGGCRRVAKPFSRDDDERFSIPSVRPTDRVEPSRKCVLLPS